MESLFWVRLMLCEKVTLNLHGRKRTVRLEPLANMDGFQVRFSSVPGVFPFAGWQDLT